MFARSVLRSAAPLKRASVRGYASAPSNGGGIGALGYSAIAATLGGGGYYYYANVLGKAPQIPAPAPVDEKAKQLAGKVAPTAKDAPKAFTGGEQGFLPLKLDHVEEVNHNVKKFFFALPEEDQVSGLSVASALVTKFKTEDMKKPVIRPYTPTSDEDTRGFIELIIKRYPNGAMSEHIFGLKPGDTLDVKGPIPKYPYAANKHNHIALIAGGTGITPMWQLARAALKNPDDKTKITLVFGNVTEEDILLKKELDDYENTYPRRFRQFHVLDNPPKGWEQGKGHITKDLLKEVLPEPQEENIKVFVCGPPGLCKAISGGKKSPQDQGELDGYLKELGYSKDQVYKF